MSVTILRPAIAAAPYDMEVAKATDQSASPQAMNMASKTATRAILQALK